MPAAKRRTPSGRGRRERILDQAERLFAVHGYHGAALAEIARAAGLGNPGLIHHFPSKRALYRAVLERVAAEIDGRLAEAFAREGSPAGRLRAFVHIQVDWSREWPLRLRLVQRELVDNAERIATASVLPLAGFVTRGREIIEAAQAAGLVVKGPAETKLAMIVGTLTYATVVRPTLQRMLRARSLRSERRWVDAVAADLLELLLGRVSRAAAADRAPRRAGMAHLIPPAAARGGAPARLRARRSGPSAAPSPRAPPRA